MNPFRTRIKYLDGYAPCRSAQHSFLLKFCVYDRDILVSQGFDIVSLSCINYQEETTTGISDNMK